MIDLSPFGVLMAGAVQREPEAAGRRLVCTSPISQVGQLLKVYLKYELTIECLYMNTGQYYVDAIL